MEIFRITQEAFADDLSGRGAYLFGGRWNSEEFYVLYAAASRSLALLETLAHTPMKLLQQKTYILITLSIPDNLLPARVLESNLPAGWDKADIHPVTRSLGDNFLSANKNLLLSVPSVMVPEENNFLINPLNRDMGKIKIVHKRKMVFDSRMDL